MNYFEFSFRENEISAVKVCMATAGNLGCGQVYTFKQITDLYGFLP